MQIRTIPEWADHILFGDLCSTPITLWRFVPNLSELSDKGRQKGNKRQMEIQ